MSPTTHPPITHSTSIQQFKFIWQNHTLDEIRRRQVKGHWSQLGRRSGRVLDKGYTVYVTPSSSWSVTNTTMILTEEVRRTDSFPHHKDLRRWRVSITKKEGSVYRQEFLFATGFLSPGPTETKFKSNFESIHILGRDFGLGHCKKHFKRTNLFVLLSNGPQQLPPIWSANMSKSTLDYLNHNKWKTRLTTR